MPLVVRWLKQEYALDFEPIPPSHIPIAYGPVTAKCKKHQSDLEVPGCSKSTQNQSVSPEDHSSDSSDEECITLMQRLTRKYQPQLHKPTKATLATMKCSVCKFDITDGDNQLSCLSKECISVSHIFCLAKHFTSQSECHELLPVEGNCPVCQIPMLWGDLIRETQGFHQYLRSKS